MISNLLATKLHRPPLPARRVERSRLVERLSQGLAEGRRLALVSAPAGFGKTSCVSEWLGSGVPARVAWLSLEPADDDPARFFAYLVAALQSADPLIGQEMGATLRADHVPPLPQLVTSLLNDILRLGTALVVVLDDFHEIRDGAILDAVGALIAGEPCNMHLVLITREDPPLPLARWRSRG